MSDLPRSISLVTGTYNRLPFLQAMVASARASAGQPIEFCIVDGGSTDGTIEWCESQPDIQLVKQDSLVGGTRAFDAGFEIATGDYVVVANDDVEFVDDTIHKSAKHLDDSQTTGAVAYENRYADGRKPYLQYPYGYLTPQCGIIRHWLGELIGWWNTEYHTYAADTEMGLRIWELGFTVDAWPDCAILDKQPVDELRKANNGMKDRNTDHPDNVKFVSKWSHRMPKPADWWRTPHDTLYQKAMRGKLKTLRFKIHPAGSGLVRTGMIRAFEKYGEAKQVITDDHTRLKPHKFQLWIEGEIEAVEPDLVLFQVQGKGTVIPQTVHKLRDLYPNTAFVNFNGDVRTEVEPILVDFAKACHLSLLPSPDLFSVYRENGADNVAYWPIAVDPEYMIDKRIYPPQYDVVFLGSNYPGFPLSDRRFDIVEALHNSSLRFGLFGFGWPDGWAKKCTADNTAENVKIYADTHLAVSCSQFDLWGYTSDRLYRICATGVPSVVRRFPGMESHGFRHGETCFEFVGASDVVSVCQACLADMEHANEVGKRGQKLIRTRHNYDERVRALLLMLDRL